MPEFQRRWKIVLMHALILPTLFFGLRYFFVTPSSWSGIDEAVVEKIAKEHGHEARRPLIDPGEGDLLLFVFLVAGACGGFAAGYHWRELFKKSSQPDRTI